MESSTAVLTASGSLGHPEVCRRQCIYFLQGNCNNGDDCAYCHLPHPGKDPKLDKRQRQLMAALTRPELFALILHLTSVRAEELELLGWLRFNGPDFHLLRRIS